MKKTRFIKKGNYGYINRKKKTESLIAIAMLALCVGVYALGFYSTGSNANLLTYVAILGCLPMAKFAVSAFMFLKAKGCSENLKNKIDAADIIPTYYDLFYTSYKKNYQISALIYKRQNLIMISEDSTISVEEAENHIKEVIKNAGIHFSCTVKIYTDMDKFLERAKELKMLEEDNSDNTFLLDNLLSVSL